MKEEPKISELSPHLFWDCDQSKITWEQNSHFLVSRILDYGLMNDWLLLKKAYGIKGIGQIATEVRYLEDKSLHFISFIAEIPLEKFRCYILKQYIPHYSGY